LSSILENSRAIVRDVYSFILKPAAAPNAPDDAAVMAVSDDLRRRLDILFAFIRQSVRECACVSVCFRVPALGSCVYMCESTVGMRVPKQYGLMGRDSHVHTCTIYTPTLTAVLGFDPDSEFRNVPFTNSTFYMVSGGGRGMPL
jgi:hypothetical protein